MQGPQLNMRARQFNTGRTSGLRSSVSADSGGVSVTATAVKQRVGSTIGKASPNTQQNVKDTLSKTPRPPKQFSASAPPLPGNKFAGPPSAVSHGPSLSSNLSAPLVQSSPNDVGPSDVEISVDGGSYQPPTLDSTPDDVQISAPKSRKAPIGGKSPERENSPSNVGQSRRRGAVWAKPVNNTGSENVKSVKPTLVQGAPDGGDSQAPPITATFVGGPGDVPGDHPTAELVGGKTVDGTGKAGGPKGTTATFPESGKIQAKKDNIKGKIGSLLDAINSGKTQEKSFTSASVAKYMDIALTVLEEQSQSGAITENQMDKALDKINDMLDQAAKFPKLSGKEAKAAYKKLMPGKNNIGGIRDIVKDALKESAKETGNKPKISGWKRFVALFKGKPAEDIHFNKIAKKIVKQTRNNQLDAQEWKMFEGTSSKGKQTSLGYVNNHANKKLQMNGPDGEAVKITNTRAEKRGISGVSSQSNLETTNRAGNNQISTLGKYGWSRHAALITSTKNPETIKNTELGDGLSKAIGLDGNTTIGEVFDKGDADTIQKLADTLMPDGANTATPKTKASINKLIKKGKFEQVEKKLAHLVANRNKAKDMVNSSLHVKMQQNPDFVKNAGNPVKLFMVSTSMLSPCFLNSVADKGYGEPEKLQEQNRAWETLSTLTPEEQQEILGDFKTEDGASVFPDDATLEVEVANFNFAVNELKGMSRGAEKKQNMAAFDKLMGKADEAIQTKQKKLDGLDNDPEVKKDLDLIKSLQKQKNAIKNKAAGGERLRDMAGKVVRFQGGKSQESSAVSPKHYMAVQDKIVKNLVNKNIPEGFSSATAVQLERSIEDAGGVFEFVSKTTDPSPAEKEQLALLDGMYKEVELSNLSPSYKLKVGFFGIENNIKEAIDKMDFPEGFDDLDTADALNASIDDAGGLHSYLTSPEEKDPKQFAMLQALYDREANFYMENSYYETLDGKQIFGTQDNHLMETIFGNVSELKHAKAFIEGEEHNEKQTGAASDKNFQEALENTLDHNLNGVRKMAQKKANLDRQIKTVKNRVNGQKLAMQKEIKVLTAIKDKFAEKFNDLYKKGKDSQENSFMLPVYSTVLTVLMGKIDPDNANSAEACALGNCKSGKDRTGEWDAKVKEMLDTITSLSDLSSDKKIEDAINHFENLASAQAKLNKLTEGVEGSTNREAANNIPDRKKREEALKLVDMLEASFNNFNESGNLEALFNTAGTDGFKLKGHFSKNQDKMISSTYGLDYKTKGEDGKTEYEKAYLRNSKLVSS